jgi:hypothetical protein
MYVVTQDKKVETYDFMRGDVGTMYMKFSRYPRIEFSMAHGIQQLDQGQVNTIKKAEKSLIHLKDKVIKLDATGALARFSHLIYNTITNRVIAVCKQGVEKTLFLNEVKEVNKENDELFKSPDVAIKESYVVVKTNEMYPNLKPGMVGTTNDTLIMFHPTDSECLIGTNSPLIGNSIRELNSDEYGHIAEAEKLRGKIFSVLRASGVIEPGWTLSYVIGFDSKVPISVDTIRVRCIGPVTEQYIDYEDLLRINPSDNLDTTSGGRFQKRAQRRSKFKRTSNYLTLKSKSKSKSKRKN